MEPTVGTPQRRVAAVHLASDSIGRVFSARRCICQDYPPRGEKRERKGCCLEDAAARWHVHQKRKGTSEERGLDEEIQRMSNIQFCKTPPEMVQSWKYSVVALVHFALGFS